MNFEKPDRSSFDFTRRVRLAASSSAAVRGALLLLVVQGAPCLGQTCGSFVLAGESSGDFAVARLTASGTLDTTFSPGGLDGSGVRRFGISGDDTARAVAVQDDGKIVVVGGTSDDVAVVRLTATGALDPTFSPGGLDGSGVKVFAVSGLDRAHAVALQPDDKIVVAGEAGGDFLVARLTASGSLDATFSPGGLDGNGVLRLGISGFDVARGLAIQPDGKIVVVGDASEDIAVVRLTANGALDTTFSPGGLDGPGVYRFNISGDDSANAVALQPDGKIVVAGNGGLQMAVVRLTSSGALDGTFSPNGTDGSGIRLIGIAGSDAANAIVLQPNGKIVVAGRAGLGFAVVRLTSGGALDTTFSPGGTGGSGIQLLYMNGADVAYGLIRLTGGKFLVAGGANGDFCVVGLNANGTLDTSFSPGGNSSGDGGSGIHMFNISGFDAAYGIAH